MSRPIVLLIASALLIVRLPSLAQPMGADQSLYAYVGERILAGGVPYVDAWDQKPPAIHYTYAALRALWPADAVVPAADLAAAAVIALLLLVAGERLGPPGAGRVAVVLFLLLSNPAFTRLAGVRVRAQAETFIAVALIGALCCLIAARCRPRRVFAAGLLIGIAITFKYNAAVYGAAALATLYLLRGPTDDRHRVAPIPLPTEFAALGAGAAVPPLLMLGWFAYAGALRQLSDATIGYNLEYSAETYVGGLDFARYLLTFPLRHSRIDALWTLGCGGCAILLMAARESGRHLVPVIWVAVACLSIAINGSRGLPQYFVQAAPFLALAAGSAGVIAARWLRARAGRAFPAAATAAAVLVSAAVWRVNQFPKLVEQTSFDARYASGAMSRHEYLGRYADERKYSALWGAQLGEFLRAHSAPGQTVYVFGFTSYAYVAADRASASRFFWSRPVIVGFRQGSPGYGADGLRAELEHSRPAVVALQLEDWAPDVDDSAHFFMSNPTLASWLTERYERAPGPQGFDVWLPRRHAIR